MLYVCVTVPSELNTMNGFAGITLIHTDTAFLVWLWSNPDQTDLQTANIVAMAAINLA